MAGRGDEAEAEALEVVEGVVERVDLELAAVARAGIDLADGKAASEPAARGRIERAPASAAISGSSTSGGGSVSGAWAMP